METPYCTLYIVRHGKAECNITQVFGTNSPLTSLGRIQAKELAERFANIKFDAAYSSDLVRAKETAEIIVAQKKLAVLTTKALRERYYGSLEGHQITRQLHQAVTELMKLSDEAVWKHRFTEDGESNEEAHTRFITFLREIAIAHPNQTVLVTSHGNIMRNLLVHLGFAKFAELRGGTIINTGFMKLKSDGVDFFIEETWGVEKNV